MLQIFGRLFLRTALAAPFVFIAAIAVGLTGYLSFRNGQAAVIDLGDQLHQEITARVHQHLESYLATPHWINELNLDSIRLGQLDVQNVNNLERPFFAQLLRLNVASVYYASEQADGRPYADPVNSAQKRCSGMDANLRVGCEIPNRRRLI